MEIDTSLETKCMSLNNELCITRSILIDLNYFKFNYYPFMISLAKCRGYCDAVDDVSANVYEQNTFAQKCFEQK